MPCTIRSCSFRRRNTFPQNSKPELQCFCLFSQWFIFPSSYVTSLSDSHIRFDVFDKLLCIQSSLHICTEYRGVTENPAIFGGAQTTTSNFLANATPKLPMYLPVAMKEIYIKKTPARKSDFIPRSLNDPSTDFLSRDGTSVSSRLLSAVYGPKFVIHPRLSVIF